VLRAFPMAKRRGKKKWSSILFEIYNQKYCSGAFNYFQKYIKGTKVRHNQSLPNAKHIKRFHKRFEKR
jgi:hypothetical protein